MEQSDFDLLLTAPPYHLQTLLKARHIDIEQDESRTDPSSSSAPEITPEIAQSLFDPAAIDEALRDLDQVERAILRELAACGGRANSRDLALYLTNAGLLSPGRKDGSAAARELSVRTQDIFRVSQPPMTPEYPMAHPHGIFEQALRRLLIAGLVFWGRQTSFAGRERDYAAGTHDGILVVPLAVQDAARRTWGPEESSHAALDQHGIGEAGQALQRTLYLYWSLVAASREGLPLLSSGLLARSGLRQVTENLGARLHIEQARMENEAPHLLFIRLLSMKLGLLRERDGTLRAVPAEPFFSLPLVERARRCRRLYVETPFWNELLYLPEVSVRPGPAPLEEAHAEVVRSRRMVVGRLLHEAPEEWHNLSTFIARCKLYMPNLLFPRQYGPRTERYSSESNPYGWDFRLRRGWLTPREGWHMIEGGFIRAVVGGPLSWLGLVDIDRSENPTAFRLAPDIGVVLSDAPLESDEQTWGRLIVQPNFELVALAPVSEALLVNLDRFAERVSLEHIAQYRLTKASVTRAIQMGLHAGEIQEALERAAGGDLPQNVRYSLVEWERQARRVEMWRETTLFEVDDAALLDALFADETTRPLLRRRLSPTLAEVAPQHLAKLQDLLWQRDYLPALASAPQQHALAEDGRLVEREPQWRLHNDGLLQPFHAVLDLYLAAEVERFTERDEPTGWSRITPASLRRALEGGMILSDIVRFLQRYCLGGVPGSLLIRLKLWGGGYEDGQEIHVEPAPMLRLSEAVLRDLQADEEIGPLLSAEVESRSRLVRVEGDNLSRVIDLLRERGFPLE
jgi:hypothetical protein